MKDRGSFTNEPHTDVLEGSLPDDRGDVYKTIDIDVMALDALTATGSLDADAIPSTSLGRLLDTFPIPAFLVDDTMSVVFSNKACEKIGVFQDHGYDYSFFDLLRNTRNRQQVFSMVRELFDHRGRQVAEGALGKDGTVVWGRIHMCSLRFGDKRMALVLVEDLTLEKKQIALIKKHSQELRAAHDQLEIRVRERTSELAEAVERLEQEIHERKQVEARLKLAANVIRSSNEAILVTDVRARIVEVNDAFCKITGYSRDDVLGENPRIMQSGKHDAQFWKNMWQTIKSTGQWQGEVWDRRKDGEIFPKLLSIGSVTDENGKVVNYVGIFSDITRIKETETRLANLAHYDPLTGLPNRMLFRDRLQQALIKAERTEQMAALMFLDLDDFKNINDTLGHRIGDRLLAAVGQRLTGCVRKSDTVSRLGGDEFTLVLTDFAQMRSLDFLARKVISVMVQPYHLEDRKVFITTSIGIAVFPHDGRDVDRLLQNADTAMYHAKKQGKNRFQYFSNEMNEQALDRLNIETELREAIQRDEFIVYYQPQAELPTGRLVGCEALIRWNHPRRGLLAPGTFIGVAEETGLINALGEWILLKACRQLKSWLASGVPPISMSVNVSGSQIRDEESTHRIADILEDAEIDHDLVDLEITESVLMENKDQSMKILKNLRGMGVKLTIDDFGTGYSSMSYLKRFPVDKLKIDQSFIKDLATDPDDQAIVRAITELGHGLKLRVTAEGVETRHQVSLLRSIGCDEVQGYFFGRPMPHDEFTQFIKTSNLTTGRRKPPDTGRQSSD